MKITTFVRTISWTEESERVEASGVSQLDSAATGQLDDAIKSTAIVVLLELASAGAAPVQNGTMRVYLHGEPYEIGPCLIFFAPSRTFRSTLGKFGSSTLRWRDFVLQCGVPATILPHRTAYQELITLLGDADAMAALEQINDVSFLRLAVQGSNKLASFMKYVDLVRFLSVDTEAFLAYTTLSRYVGENRVERIPPPQNISCEMQAGTALKRVELWFPVDPLKGRQPINAIIGPNGSGKTRTLCALAKRFQGSGADWPRQVLLYVQDRSSSRDNGVRPGANLKINPVRPQWKDITKKLEDISARCIRDPAEVSVIDRLFSDVVPTTSLHVPLNSESIGEWGKRTIRQSGITYISYDAYLRDVARGNRLILLHGAAPLVADGSGTLFPPSSGEATIMALLASILVDASSSALVLIDEPETNLHPRFIALLMAKVADMLLATDSLAVLATHSPFVVRELDKTAVTVMRRNGSQASDILYPTLQTHGANVGDISSYVFEDDDLRKGYETAIESISISKSLSRDATIKMAFERFGSDAVNFALGRTER